jgi:hypothetical protein
MNPARASLARQQRELALALSGRGDPPAGFDRARVAAASQSLARKRERLVEKQLPRLVECLGPRFHRLFSEYRRETVLASGAASLEDARMFCRWLAGHCELREDAKRELLRIRCRWSMQLLIAAVRRACFACRLSFTKIGGE